MTHNIFERYRDEVSPKKPGGRWEIVRINRILKELKGNPSIDQLKAWRDMRLQTVTPASVNRELNLISAVYSHAIHEWNYKHPNPVKLIKRPPRTKPRKRRVAQHEMEELTAKVLPRKGYGATRDYIPWMFEFGVQTGLRLGEMCALLWTDVHDKYVHVSKSKNGDERDVPLTKRAREILNTLDKRAARVFPVNKGSAGAMFRKMCKKMNVTDLHFHDSRHEATSRLAKKLHVLELAAVIGHRDLKSLMVYYNPTAEELADKLG